MPGLYSALLAELAPLGIAYTPYPWVNRYPLTDEALRPQLRGMGLPGS